VTAVAQASTQGGKVTLDGVNDEGRNAARPLIRLDQAIGLKSA